MKWNDGSPLLNIVEKYCVSLTVLLNVVKVILYYVEVKQQLMLLPHFS